MPQGPSSPEDAKAYMDAHPADSHPQMNPWNGGPGRAQCEWLEQELSAAAAAGKQVIMSCHHPVGWGCARPTHMAWNWKELHAMMVHAGCVRLALHGHDHEGGYAVVDGIHYVTLPGLVEGTAVQCRWGDLLHTSQRHSAARWQCVQRD